MERLAVGVVVVGLLGQRTRSHIQLTRRAVAVGEDWLCIFISKRLLDDTRNYTLMHDPDCGEKRRIGAPGLSLALSGVLDPRGYKKDTSTEPG